MEGAKIQFSVAEIELMNNANILFAKNKVQEKIRLLLEMIQKEMLVAETSDPLFDLPPKISKGENYSGLPYLVLDYPRYFNGVNIALIRSMFWWGNFFSSTLHLSGSLKYKYVRQIKDRYSGLAAGGYYIGINADPWQHHFGDENYQPIKNLSEQDFIDSCTRFNHIKIASKWSLDGAHFGTGEALKSWYFLLRLVGLIAS